MVRTGQPDGVHQVRVAGRRLRSTLAAFRPVLDRTHTDPIRDELAQLGTALSPARDGEVALAHLRELVAAQPPELVLGPVAARLQQAAIKDEHDGEVQARRALNSPGLPAAARRPGRPGRRAAADRGRGPAGRRGAPGGAGAHRPAARARGRRRPGQRRPGGAAHRAQGGQAGALHRGGGRPGARPAGGRAGQRAQGRAGGARRPAGHLRHPPAVHPAGAAGLRGRRERLDLGPVARPGAGPR